MLELKSGPLAVIGGTLIDGNGGKPLENAVILIEDGRITAVGDGATPLPPQAKRLSAAGRYIIPGLMDANVHLYFQSKPAELLQGESRYQEHIAAAAQLGLRNGLTTLFDTWGPRAALTSVRDRINRGELTGSRIFFAGNIIGLGGPTTTDFFPAARAELTPEQATTIDSRWEQGVGPDLLWMTAEQVRTRIRAYIASGTQNFLKYAASGHGQYQYICFSEKAQRVIVEEAHRAGLTVQSHTTSPESLRMAIEAGVDLLQHPDLSGMTPIPEEILADIAQRRTPCAALFFTRRFAAWNDSRIPEPYRTFNKNKHHNHGRLVATEARLLLTTDAADFASDTSDDPALESFTAADDSPLLLGISHFLWLEAAAELGMKSMDALMAATRNIAEAYQVDRDLGTLVKGKIADLLILEKNPLESAAHYRTITTIVKDGNIIDPTPSSGRATSAESTARVAAQ